MNKTQHLAYNAALSSNELIDTIASNIAGFGKNGHRAQRWAFSDFMTGGDVQKQGVSWRQGPQEPRIGEWTKMMIRGRGVFSVKDPRSQKTYFTRLGDFHIDGQGNLVTAEGFEVQGKPLAGSFTRLAGPNPADPDDFGNVNFGNPFENPKSFNRQELNKAGQAVGDDQTINLKLDPRNGKYLGYYDSLKIGEDGVIYGKDGQNLVSLFKIRVSNFNNPGGLRDVKDGIYWKATKESGPPSLAAGDSVVISEALEKSNTWLKVETHYLTDAQRYYQVSTQLHKLSDKVSATAIEMIQ